MNVVLLNPPDLNSLDSQLDPPLGLMYISSYLKSQKIDTKLIDLCWYNDLDIVKENFADLYGITVYTSSLNYSIDLGKYIKSIYPQSKIIVGGPHFSSLPDLKDYPFDYICVGEGEDVLLNLCNNKIDKIKSIFSLPYQKVLDNLPFPDRESIPIRNYTRSVQGIHSCAIQTSRGCYGKCAFCNSPFFWNGKVRMQSSIKVINELKEIKNKYGFKSVHFWDDIFTLNNSRLEHILKGIKDLGLIFRCNGDLRRDSVETLQKLFNAGCKEWCVGVESGSQKVLNAIHKDTEVEKSKYIIKEAKRIGLKVKEYLMVGLPSETWEDVKLTLKFVEETEPDYWTLFSFIPLPGSDSYHNSDKYGIKFRTNDSNQYFCIGGENIGGLTHDIVGGLLLEEIEEARQYLIKNLPTQKGYLQNYYKKE